MNRVSFVVLSSRLMVGVHLASVLMAFVLVACGGGVVSEAAPAPVPKSDCGDVTYGNGGQCPEGLEAKLACFFEAKRTCRSSRIGITRLSVEGDPILTELIIDDACKVLVRDDDSADKYSANPGVRTRTCADVSRSANPGGGACSELVTCVSGRLGAARVSAGQRGSARVSAGQRGSARVSAGQRVRVREREEVAVVLDDQRLALALAVYRRNRSDTDAEHQGVFLVVGPVVEARAFVHVL